MVNPQIPQKPGVVPASEATVKEPVIRTIPEKYIGAPAGRPPLIREVVETKVVQSPASLPPPPPAPRKQNKGSRFWIIVASAIVLLSGIGAVAYVLFIPVEEAPLPPPVVANKPVVNTNVNTPPPPPAPVCGNGIIETAEECDDGNILPNDGCNNVCILEPKPALPPGSGKDSDSDGLTDAEEKEIFITDLYNNDTDRDSFNDGNEVAHLYDPSVKAPAALNDSPVVKTVKSLTQKYSVIVPKKWVGRGEDTDAFFATAATGEFLEVLVTEKPQDQSLIEWYLGLSSGAKPEEVERIKTIQGYDALRSPDRLTTYIESGSGRVFTLVMSYDDQGTIDYRTTYEMFVGSFTMLEL